MNVQKEIKIFKMIFFQLLLPLCCVIVLTIINCLLDYFYFDLPTWVGVFNGYLFEFTNYILATFIFFSIGISYYSIVFFKWKNKILSVSLGIVSSIGIPFGMSAIRVVYYNIAGGLTSSYDLDSYINSDAMIIYENTLKYIVSILLLLVVLAILKLSKKKDIPFTYPYILPNEPLQLVLLCFFFVIFAISLFLFLRDTEKNYISLIVEFVYFLSGYFASALGLYLCKKYEFLKE